MKISRLLIFLLFSFRAFAQAEGPSHQPLPGQDLINNWTAPQNFRTVINLYPIAAPIGQPGQTSIYMDSTTNWPMMQPNAQGIFGIPGIVQGTWTQGFCAVSGTSPYQFTLQACGAGGGTTLETNGTLNPLQTTLNLVNSLPFYGLTSTVTAGSGGVVQLGLVGTLGVFGGGSGANTLTGVIKGNGTSPFTAATSADVIALWSGTCNSSSVLFGNGTCQTVSGIGNVSVVGVPTQFQTAVWVTDNTIEGIGPGTSGLPLVSGGASANPSYSQLADGALTSSYSGVGSCSSNQWVNVLTRNAAPTCSQPAFSNISGTATSGQLPSTTVEAVNNDTNVTGSIAAQALTLGWTGTLAAGRLNANVVQAVTNDTNVTGSIATQNLTLGWTGTLAAGRLNSNVVQSVVNDTNVTGSIATQALTLGWTGTLSVSRGGIGVGTLSGIAKGNGTSAFTAAASADVIALWTGTCNSSTFLTGNGTCSAGAGGNTTSTSLTSGTIPVANGATSLVNSSLTDNLSTMVTTTEGITAASVTDTGLTSGNCVQASTGGKLVTIVGACGTSTGTVTVTGSPASGNITEFSGGTSITNGDLSGDVTTSGTLATTVVQLRGIALPTLAASTGLFYDNSGVLSLQATLPTAAVPAFTGDMTNSAGSLATTVAKLENIALPTLAASTGLFYDTSGTLSLQATLPTAAEPAHTGDVTNSAGSLATTVGKLENIALPTLAASTGLFYDNNGVLSLQATLPTAAMPALTGDITTPGGSLATTLATVNSNVGTFTNATITVNAKGLITAASSGSGGGGSVTTTGTPANGNLAKFSGASSITNGDLSGDVTTSGTLATTVGKLENIALPTLAASTGLFYDNSGTLSLQATLPTAAMPALTGDVTNSAGSLTTTVTQVEGAVIPLTVTILGTNNLRQLITTALPSADIFVGNSFNLPVAAPMTGDATISNVGAVTNLKVNGVSYPPSPALNTIPIVTATNAVTYATANYTPNQTVTFTNQTSVTITASFSSSALVWQCWDNNNPANAIYPGNVSLNTSTYAITFTFSVAQSGYCAINGSGGLGVSNGSSGGNIIVNNLLVSKIAPTISTHFNTSGDSVSVSNGTGAFKVVTGNGTLTSGGVLTMPTAVTGWNCPGGLNQTAHVNNRADDTIETASTTTSVTLQNQNKTTGTAVNYTSGDVLVISCFAY